jgi:predicted DNA-binding protein (MmcQ/YjbR family)
MSRKAGIQKLGDTLRDYAMSFPGATEDFPWGERVVKVNKKVFVFLGKGEEFGFSVKLPESLEDALALPYTEPTPYGLGKHGWVTARIDAKTNFSVKMFKEWIEESYRAVAPKKLIKELDSA